MRDDSGVNFALLAMFVYMFGTQLAVAFGRGSDDANWEFRFRGLDDLDQAWIAATSRTSTSRPELEERGELELAKGFGRRERRYRARIEVLALPILIGIGALAVFGALPFGLGLAMLADLTLRGAIDLWRNRQIKTKYREVQARHLAVTGIAPTPAL
jgi:hypothetical protein